MSLAIDLIWFDLLGSGGGRVLLHGGLRLARWREGLACVVVWCDWGISGSVSILEMFGCDLI
jgi:hypothetical protein